MKSLFDGDAGARQAAPLSPFPRRLCQLLAAIAEEPARPMAPRPLQRRSEGGASTCDTWWRAGLIATERATTDPVGMKGGETDESPQNNVL